MHFGEQMPSVGWLAALNAARIAAPFALPAAAVAGPPEARFR
jgi:hypothetical protein